MGGSSSQTTGYEYRTGLHGVFARSLDKILRFRVGERTVWEGDWLPGTSITVSAPNLHGNELEGGVGGTIDFEGGGVDQGVNDYLASKLYAGGLVSAFRGVAALVFRQFWWGNNPYYKPFDATGQRIFSDWDYAGGCWYRQVAAIPTGEWTSEATRPPMYPWLDDIDPRDQRNLHEYRFAGPFDYPYTPTWHANIDDAIADGVAHGWVPGSAPGSAVTTANFANLIGWDRPGSADWADGHHVYNSGYWSLYPLGLAPPDDEPTLVLHFNSMSATPFAYYPQPSPPADWWCGTASTLAFTPGDGQAYWTNYGNYVSKKAPGKVFLEPYGEWDTSAQKAIGSCTNYDPVEAYYPQTVLSMDYLLECRRVGLSGELASGIYYDMNPAHIVYQAYTHPALNGPATVAQIDDVSFRAAALGLYNEGFGLSFFWASDSPIEDFVAEVLRHIDAVTYVDRRTGKLKLKLIRDDYTVGDLLVLDQSNVVEISDWKVSGVGDLVNYVTVRYTDRDTGNQASVSEQNTALYDLQGGVVAVTHDYPGVTSPSLAARLAARDLRALSTPLASGTIVANRAASGLNLGDVFVLNHPDVQASGMVCRIVGIAYGNGRDNRVRTTVVQDIFTFPQAAQTPSASAWTNPVGAPTAPPHHAAIEAPYYAVVRQLGQSAADTALAATPEIGYLMAAADRPNGGAINATLMVDSGAGYVSAGTVDFCPSAVTTAAVGYLDTTVAITSGSDLDQVVAGGYALIDTELVKVVSVTDSLLTMARGVLDTIPAEHAAGAVVLFLSVDAATDGIQYLDGEVIDAKVLPRTSQGTLAVADATADTVTMDSRAARPYPPGQVKVNAEYFPTWIDGAEDLAVTWAHRDRIQQTGSALLDFTSGGVGPEEGATYTLRIYGEDDNLLRTYSGLAGAAQTYDSASELSDGGTWIPNPNWADTDLLLAMDGAAASTTFIDSSPLGLAVTRYGGATHVADVDAWGGLAGVFDGTGDYLTVPNDGRFNPGAGDFTIRARVKPSSLSGVRYIAGTRNDTGTTKGWVVYLDATYGVRMAGWASGTVVMDAGSGVVPATSAYCEIEVGKSGANWYLFMDGVLAATDVESGAVGNTSTLTIGRHLGNTTRDWIGRIDFIEIIPGVCLHTESFAVDTHAPGPGHYDARRNGRLRIELESVRPLSAATVPPYQAPLFQVYGGGTWVGQLNVGTDATYYRANADLSVYTPLSLAAGMVGEMAYGGGIWLLVGTGGTCWISSDLATWTDHAMPVLGAIRRILHDGSKFVVFAYHYLHTTTDGVTWTEKKLFAQNINDAAYDGSSVWMVVGDNGVAPYVATSTDLATWTDVTPDLDTWHATDLPGQAAGRGSTISKQTLAVAYAGGAFLVGGTFVEAYSVTAGGGYLFYPLVYRYAGSTWTDVCPPMLGSYSINGGYPIKALEVLGTKVIALGLYTAAYATAASVSTTVWGIATFPAGVVPDVRGKGANSGTLLVIGQGAGEKVLTTTDGMTYIEAPGVVADSTAWDDVETLTSLQHYDITVKRTGWTFNWDQYWN